MNRQDIYNLIHMFKLWKTSLPKLTCTIHPVFKKQFSFLLAGICIYNYADCQRVSLSGYVISDGKPLIKATVKLLNSDSALVKTNLTNLAGRFMFTELEPGEYFIEITDIGYKSLSQKVNLKESFETGQIVLESEPVNLREVTVTGKKPVIEFRKNLLVFNVTDDLRKSSSSGAILLNKAPGLNIKNDLLTLDGLSGIIITINGKEQFASTTEALNFLKTLPPERIKFIEINSTPSAKYDKSVNGIVNIVLFKDETQGLKGNIQAYLNTGKRLKSGAALNLTYRRSNWNYFGVIKLDKENIYSTGTNETIFSSATETAVTEDITTLNRPFKKYIRLGFDVDINKRNFLSAVTSLTLENANNREFDLQRYFGNNSAVPDLVLQLHDSTFNKNKNSFTNINYSSLLDSASEQKIDITVSYLNSRPVSNSAFTHQYTDAYGSYTRSSYILHGLLKNYVDMLGIVIDYTRKIKSKFDFSTGLKFVNTKTSNNVQYDTLSQDRYLPFVQLSSQTKYSENLYAAYINIARYQTKWAYECGLRYEAARVFGKTNGSNEPVDKLFTGLNPSLMIRYNLDKKNKFVFRASKEVYRPIFDNLNPYIQYISPTLYSQGNLNLRQTNGYIASLRYSYKQKYNATLRYDFVNNFIPQTLFVKETNQNVIKSTYANAGRLSGFQLVINIPFDITPKWSLSNYFNAFYTKVRAVDARYEGLDYKTANLFYQMKNTFKLPEEIYTEITLSYMTPGRINQSSTLTAGSMDINLTKSLLSDKLKLSLDFQDILYTDVERGKNIYNNTVVTYRKKSDSRRVGLTLTFDFGRNQVSGPKERQTGIENETNRVKN